MKYSIRIDPFEFENLTFSVVCRDRVIQGRIQDYICGHGGRLSAQNPDVVIGEHGLTPVQFWIGAGAYDLLQRGERMEEALIFLSSDTVFAPGEVENICWYIRENRDAVIAKILEENCTTALRGFLDNYDNTLPGDFAVLQTDDYRQQILLDLTAELIQRTDAAGRHELTAWLLEYRKNTFPDAFVEAVEQDRLDKELGLLEQNEYDWLKLFSFVYEEDGVHIERYKGEDPFVFIPDAIDGKPVTSVAIRNFYGETGRQYAWQRPAHLMLPVDGKTLAAAQVGDTITFGLYPVDKSGNTAPMEWTVLKKEDSRILVITTKIIDKSAYHSLSENLSWETSHLRAWLNGPFYQLAFTPEEQSMIPRVSLSPTVNPKYHTTAGGTTQDRVFVLSLEEAGAWFPDDPSRLGYTTLYAQSRGYYFGGSINCWWLRDLGASPELEALVGNSGSLGTYGYRADNSEYAIRPAMWIDLGGFA